MIVYSGGIVDTSFTLSTNGAEIAAALGAAGWSGSIPDMFSVDPAIAFGAWQSAPMQLGILKSPSDSYPTAGWNDYVNLPDEFSIDEPGQTVVRVGPKIGVDARATNQRCDDTDPACKDTANCASNPFCCKVDWVDVRNIYRAYALFPGRKYRCIANQFQFFIFEENPIDRAGSFVAGGVLYIEAGNATETHVPGVANDGPFTWWITGSSTGGKTNDAYIPSFRSVVNLFGDPFFYRHTNGLGTRSGFYVAPSAGPDPCPSKSPSPRRILTNQSTITQGIPVLMQADGESDIGPPDLRWHLDDAIKIATRLAFHCGDPDQPANPPSPDGVSSIKGQIWDSVVVMEKKPTNITMNFDGHTWFNIMHECDMGLWVAIT